MAEEFASWQAPGHDNEVSYSVAAIESMRRNAVVGLQKIPKRGLEIGGILFGRHEGNRVEIHQWREIECEHARGPGFELSESDEARLQQFLSDAASDPTLGEFEPVGLFRSRTRGTVFLSESDVAIFDRFFPEPWQVALVIRPYTYEPALAGFFIREASGNIQRESSLKSFELENQRKRVPLGFDPSQAPRRPLERESNAWSGHPVTPEAAPPRAPVAQPTQQPVGGVPGAPAESGAPVQPPRPPRPMADYPVPVRYGGAPDDSEPRSKRKLALIGVLAFLVILIGVTLGVPALSGPSSRGIDLEVRDVNGQLVVEWDNDNVGVQRATAATLTIKDGPDSHEVRLSPDELQGGKMVYERKMGTVELGLILEIPGKEPLSEYSHFVATEPVVRPSAPMHEELTRAMREERDLLQQRLEAEARELEALQAAVDQEKARLGE